MYDARLFDAARAVEMLKGYGLSGAEAEALTAMSMKVELTKHETESDSGAGKGNVRNVSEL